MFSSDSSDDDETIATPKNFKERVNFNFYSDFEFNERFRLSRTAVETILKDIGPILQHPTNRSHALEPRQQLLILLHWLGNGGQYHGIADMHGVAKSTVCRTIQKVVKAINHVLFKRIVTFPENVMPVVQKFQSIGGMPQVVGVLVGTLVNIDAPHEYEEQYIDRHGNHSLNCMVMCGPDRRFFYASAKWPGSVDDSRVLRNSTLYRRMEEEGWRPVAQSIILADSGYALKEWLITPMLTRLDDESVRKFNRAHKRTRSIGEQAIGILKEKFPCLNHLRVQPIDAGNIFKCCVTLHNIALDENAEAKIEVNDDDDFHVLTEDLNNEEDDAAGTKRRQQLFNHFQ